RGWAGEEPGRRARDHDGGRAHETETTAARGKAVDLGHDNAVQADQCADRYLQIGGDLAQEVAEPFALRRKFANVTAAAEVRAIATQVHHAHARVGVAAHHSLME